MAHETQKLKPEAIRLHTEQKMGASAIAREPQFRGRVSRATIRIWINQHNASQTTEVKAS
jgi:hypothetical protein